MTTYQQGAFMNICKVVMDPNPGGETQRHNNNIQNANNSLVSLKQTQEKNPNPVDTPLNNIDPEYLEVQQDHNLSKISSNADIVPDLNTLNNINNTVFNFFSFPKYGLCEQSTQTMLTGNDIEELQYLRKEFSNFQEQFMKDYVKNNLHMIKKMFPEEKCSKFNSPQSSPLINNFISIKRKTDNQLNLRPKRNVSSSLFNMFGDRPNASKAVGLNGSSPPATPGKHGHIHLKARQKKHKDVKPDPEIGLIGSHSVPEIPSFNLDTLESLKTASKPSLEDINISEMINSIKNSTSTKKERNIKASKKVIPPLLYLEVGNFVKC